jgi:thiamine biosynthesis protein ThiS
MFARQHCQTPMGIAATKSIQIAVNGEPKMAPQGLNVAQLLDFLAIDAGRVAVELNRSIVHKADWISTRVEEGALVEVVWFVGGG